MLMLSSLNGLLSQVLSPPNLHTAVLLSPAGELVSFASQPSRSKDQVRIIVGLCTETWQETKQFGCGMIDSELGRIVVVPIDEFSTGTQQIFPDEHQPLMLLALNATDAVEWEELLVKGKALAGHLSKPLGKYREHITISQSSPTATAAASLAPMRT
ncbi:hypothetical protein HYPSUDRAFT_34065 [Hypholoma sublateritium FD-334 SS-4]|uniref:Roadblock/LAMTOR2 domain-containing protein n=1 Tax=Hypholoma sublateritium (strain FD-334 SS-4) TaxID=945553 RepID=A0A0D2PJP9_HYPSF|nr:hypothetical protein HYPSUDRAFT_34065 [Hypholoma sublateritium FD-334 SS-4]